MLLQAAGPEWLQQALGPAGLLAFLLIAVVWGGIKQWWVFGWHYKEVVKDRDDWKSIAMKGTHAAEQMGSVARSMTDQTLEEMAQQVDAARRRGDLDDA